MPSGTLHKLALVCLISSAVPAVSALSTAVLAARRVGLLPPVARDTQTCGGLSNLFQCSNNLPSDFCCQSGSTCLKLNNTVATSVICCPSGSDCKLIKPVTCDITRQNATLYPNNPLHSADMSIKLDVCAEGCCPLGYTCQNGKCAMSASTSNPPSSASSASPSASITASPTGDPSATPTSITVLPTSIPAVTPQAKSAGFSGRSFIAGFIPGIVLGALLLFGLMWIIKQRRKRKNRYSGDFGPVSYNVSDPIYNPIFAARTDFLRRGSVNSPSKASPGSRTSTLLNSASKDSPAQHGIREAYQPKMKTKRSLLFRSSRPQQDPYTPTRMPARSGSNSTKHRSNLTRSGSTETIDVLMPAPSFLLEPPPALKADNGRPLTSDTTFTKLMAHAGYGRDSQDGVRKMSTRLQDQIKHT